MTLGILVPSRGRPENLARFINAVRDTAEDYRIYVRLDYDDPALGDYLNLPELTHLKVLTVQGRRSRFGPSLNELARYAVDDGMDFIGMFADDVVPITPRWDIRLMAALDDVEGLGVAYGDDGLRDKHAPDLPTHYITQAEVYQRLGYLAPMGIQHLFLDNVARDIGRRLGNLVYVPVQIKHMHPWAEGEQLHDQTYAEGGRNAEIRKSDRKAYIKWTARFDWKRSLQ